MASLSRPCLARTRPRFMRRTTLRVYTPRRPGGTYSYSNKQHKNGQNATDNTATMQQTKRQDWLASAYAHKPFAVSSTPATDFCINISSEVCSDLPVVALAVRLACRLPPPPWPPPGSPLHPRPPSPHPPHSPPSSTCCVSIRTASQASFSKPHLHELRHAPLHFKCGCGLLSRLMGM
jgi:hypothetical protein